MRLTDFMSEKLIFLDIEATSKQELLTTMSRLLEENGAVRNGSKFFSEIWKREMIEKTTVGKGVAIPHARTSAAKNIVVALARLRNEVDFQALDQVPVRIVFLIGAPSTMANEYLKVLSKISKLVRENGTRKSILAADSPAQILELIDAMETNLANTRHAK